jgi:hypothetical protein
MGILKKPVPLGLVVVLLIVALKMKTQIVALPVIGPVVK